MSVGDFQPEDVIYRLRMPMSIRSADGTEFAVEWHATE